MKDLIHSAAALILGLILGVLTTILALIGLGAYVYLDETSKKPKREYKYGAKSKTDEPKAEEKN